MAEKQDIREDQMTVASSVDYIRGLKGKDSVLIAMNSLFSGVIMSKGGLNYSNVESVANLTTPGVYNHGDVIVGTNGSYGLLLVLKSGEYVGQIDFTANGKIIYRFSANNGNGWTGWKSITLT